MKSTILWALSRFDDVEACLVDWRSYSSARGSVLEMIKSRLEGQVALEEVLDRWPAWQVDHGKAKRAHTSTVPGWEHLPVLV
jgi:cytochrome P450